eukprot:1147331-Pelagomonas_calceolata.AAC.2
MHGWATWDDGLKAALLALVIFSCSLRIQGQSQAALAFDKMFDQKCLKVCPKGCMCAMGK